VHLKGGRGPITVLTYDIVAEGDPEKKKSFLTLEESRIATAVLLTGNHDDTPVWPPPPPITCLIWLCSPGSSSPQSA